jgi:D-amino-acid dehydrogenase
MRVAVIGAGIIGVTSAYELAADGHDVTVFERRSAVAEETSFGNAGVVAPGYVTPWSAPGMPAKVLRYLLSPDAPVRISWPLSAIELSWMWRWWRACKLSIYQINRTHMQRLALYSKTRLHALSANLHLDYERAQGYLVLLRSEIDSKLAQTGLAMLRTADIGFKEIDAAEARRIEPALSTDTHLHGGIYMPHDEVGNCRQFALLLKAQAQVLGANFVFNKSVARLDVASPGSLWLDLESQPRQFDAIVLCAGLESAALLGKLGLHIPMAPIYGYSLSAAVREPLNAPKSAVMDERYKVAISRIGQRVRVAGGAELGGRLGHHSGQAIATLYKVLNDWFPGAAQLTSHSQGRAIGTGVQIWKGARPMLADGPPLLGASGVPKLWVNTGHGSSGWALSCGSARAVADLIAGRPPELDLTGLGIERLLA